MKKLIKKLTKLRTIRSLTIEVNKLKKEITEKDCIIESLTEEIQLKKKSNLKLRREKNERRINYARENKTKQNKNAKRTHKTENKTRKGND